MIVIVDYGMGNLRSVRHAVEAAGASAEVTGDPGAVEQAEKVILPGVGAFGAAMRELDRRGLVPILKRHLAAGKPFLGICLGCQILFESSEEAPGMTGLGVFKGRVVSFRKSGFGTRNSQNQYPLGKSPPSPGPSFSGNPSANPEPQVPSPVLKVPHMGWSPVTFRKSHPYLAGIPDNTYFYFVHSFFPAPADTSLVAGEAVYGRPFAAMIATERILATQFHPEKSAAMGIRLLKNFLGTNE
ncbi:MAG: imidazole glycerol phosphate synthase subunit HisH [Planctomycetota bacterium]